MNKEFLLKFVLLFPKIGMGINLLSALVYFLCNKYLWALYWLLAFGLSLVVTIMGLKK